MHTYANKSGLFERVKIILGFHNKGLFPRRTLQLMTYILYACVIPLAFILRCIMDCNWLNQSVVHVSIHCGRLIHLLIIIAVDYGVIIY